MDPYAVCAAVNPVLLGCAHASGDMAQRIYRYHTIKSHHFGKGINLKLLAYTKHHSFSFVSDGIKLSVLASFAEKATSLATLPILIPCDADSAVFCDKFRDFLESRYIILDIRENGDPLLSLLFKN